MRQHFVAAAFTFPVLVELQVPLRPLKQVRKCRLRLVTCSVVLHMQCIAQEEGRSSSSLG